MGCLLIDSVRFGDNNARVVRCLRERKVISLVMRDDLARIAKFVRGLRT
jgi:hypothetical protein